MDKVTVIIPTYKRSDYLINAINSVLDQTYENIEIIIVDDNGDESEYRRKTIDKINDYLEDDRIVYVPLHNNVGGAMARNVGIKLASGDYITFLDDDDTYLPTKIQVQLSEMKKHNWDVSVMDGKTYNEEEDLLSVKTQKITNNMTKKDLIVAHLMYHISGTNTFMFKTDAIRNIGGFMNIVACQEYMLMQKVIDSDLKIGYINKALVKNYIRRGERLSSSEKKYKAEKIMYNEKKKYFSYLNNKQKRYVSCRHYGVLFYVQLKRKKFFSASGYLVLTILYSPKDAFNIYKDYKGKLTQ